MDENGREPYVHVADLEPLAGLEPDAVGAAGTIALCGSTDHEGPCRWPNNHQTDSSGPVWHYRVLFVSPPDDEQEVRRRLEEMLRTDPRWRVRRSGPRPLTPEEREGAERLARTPLRPR